MSACPPTKKPRRSREGFRILFPFTKGPGKDGMAASYFTLTRADLVQREPFLELPRLEPSAAAFPTKIACRGLRRGPKLSILTSMSLKNAATLALVGTLLTAALLVWRFVFDVVHVLQGLVPAVDLFSSLLFAFAAVSLTVFLYVIQKSEK
jgi:hypothetical protein